MTISNQQAIPGNTPCHACHAPKSAHEGFTLKCPDLPGRNFHHQQSAEYTSRMTPEFEARLREQQSAKDLLAQDLRHKYLIERIPDDIAERVFRKAWDEGHANGDHEVEQQYDDLSEIVNKAFRAGQDLVQKPWGGMSDDR